MSSDGSYDGDACNPLPYAEYLRTLLLQGLLEGKLPVVTTNPNRLQAQAEKVMTKKGFDYVFGGAGEASTIDANRLAFRQWKILPRILTPTNRDLSITLFGQKYATPLLAAPVGVQSYYHEDKEIGTAKACAALHVPFTMSTASSTGIEELTQAASVGPKWFQLYWPTDEEITASILRRVKENGFTTLVVTLDTWTLAWRPYDLDTANIPFVIGEGNTVGFTDPVFRRKFAAAHNGDAPENNPIQAAAYWTGQIFPGVSRSWEDLKTLRKYWDGPIVLKGILSTEDALLAVQHGIDGLIVSNHGGRQLDGAVAALDMLPEVVAAVGGKLTVMFDSGIRTGADIVKALALGARAVFVGRPVVYGLGVNGKEGAQAVLAGLLADLDLTMGFVGASKISDLSDTLLRKTSLPSDRHSNF